MKDGNFPEGK